MKKPLRIHFLAIPVLLLAVAHAWALTRLPAQNPNVARTVLWLVTTSAVMASALGLLRIPPFARGTRAAALTAGAAALLFLLSPSVPGFMVALCAADLVLLAVFRQPRAEWLNGPGGARYGFLIADHPARRWLGNIALLGLALMWIISL